jgi:hypothetical protein
VLGLAYFAFLYADIRRYLRKVKSRNPVLLNKDGETLAYMLLLCVIVTIRELDV